MTDRHPGTVFGRLKEAAGHTVVYGLGSVAQTLLGLLLLPLYAHAFTPAEFGVFSLITLAATLAGVVFYLGSSSALARSYFDYAPGIGRQQAVTTSLAVTLGGAALQIVLALLLSKTLSVRLFGTEAYAPHLAVALAASAVTFINGLFLVVLRFERRSTAVVASNVGALALTTALVFWMIFGLELGVMAPLAANLAAQVFMCAVLGFAARRLVGGGISRTELTLQLRFGFGAVCIGAAYYVLSSVDRFLLNRFATLDDVGVYSLGYRLGMLIHIVFILPFSQIWAPMRMQYRDEAEAPELFTLVLTYYWMIGSLATVAVGLFAREIVAFTSAADYHAAYRVVPIIMMAHLIYGVIGVIDSGIIFSRKVSYQAVIFAVGVVLNMALNLVLIPRWGYTGAAWAALASYAAVAAAAFVVSNRLYPVGVEWARLAKVAASAVAALVVGVSLATSSSAFTIGARLSLFIGLGVFWYLSVLSDRERSRLRQLTARFV